MFTLLIVFTYSKMKSSLLHCMFLMLNSRLINRVGCQDSKLIYYLHHPHQKQISLHSYHPAITNYSQHITSFWYPCTDYQVAPIWDCKVALIGGISNTSGVRCPYTGIVDMPSLTFKKSNFTLKHERTKFATELVSKRKLFVCGGMAKTENACEIWTKGQLQFATTNYIWDQLVGPRSWFTLHQLGDQLCAFGGTKMNDDTLASTNKVHCFNTSQPITNRNYAIQENYSLSSYRGGHSSIVHRQTNTSWKVFLCGGIGIKYKEQTCEAFTVTTVKGKSAFDYCFPCYGKIGKYCKLIATDGVGVGLVFGVHYNLPSGSDETQVSDFYPTPFTRPLPVKHKREQIQLFKIDDHCPVPKQLKYRVSSGQTVIHSCSNPTAPQPGYMGTSTPHSDKECYTSAFLAIIVLLSVIIAILAMVIIGILTRRNPHMTEAATQTKCPESITMTGEDNNSVELQELESNAQDARGTQLQDPVV